LRNREILIINKSFEIAGLPDIPTELLERINEKKVAFFLGAGVSRIIGCGGWKSLASNLVEKCFKEKLINYKVRESILRIEDPKKTTTICYNILERNGARAIFFDEIRKALTPNPDLLANCNVYSELSGISAVYITTNIDTHFDSTFTNRIAYRITDFKPENVFRDKLYKIHGTIEDENSLIFTLPQYFERYKNLVFQQFLKRIFSDYTIVFLGYGLEEFEVLDFLVTKFGEEKVELKHWILLPYYRDEQYLLDYDNSYFNSIGIRVLGYEKDEKGYSQLFEVIKKWKGEVRQLSTLLDDDIREMEETVDKL
jgi:hypothetical protein